MLDVIYLKSIQVSVNTSNLISAKISTGSWQDADVRYRQCHTSSMLEIPSHSKTPPSKVFDSEIKLALIQCSNAVRTQIPKSIESMQKIWIQAWYCLDENCGKIEAASTTQGSFDFRDELYKTNLFLSCSFCHTSCLKQKL